jgi:NAD(P)-dependent dehydrogenase (short-subunit alcohol dehydrogenase family)
MKILITGGSSGLGKAIVNSLSLNKDYKIYYTYNSNKPNELSLEESNSNTKSYFCDFTNEDSVNELCNKLSKLDIDVLINNAYFGKALNNSFIKTKATDYQESFLYNILPTIKITQEAIKIFKLKKFGKIINILSSYILNAPPLGTSIYVANKAYLLELSKVWSKELNKFNITSNSISPDLMITNLTNAIDERIIEQITKAHPYNKLLDTTEVAAVVDFLIKSSQQINGVNIPINAGQEIL